MKSRNVRLTLSTKGLALRIYTAGERLKTYPTPIPPLRTSMNSGMTAESGKVSRRVAIIRNKVTSYMTWYTIHSFPSSQFYSSLFTKNCATSTFLFRYRFDSSLRTFSRTQSPIRYSLPLSFPYVLSYFGIYKVSRP